MATYGLRTWDANGVLTLDVTDRLTKILGTVTVRAQNNTGSATRVNTVPAATNLNFWIAPIAVRSLYAWERVSISYVLGSGYADIVLKIEAFEALNGWVEYDILYGVY